MKRFNFDDCEDSMLGATRTHRCAQSSRRVPVNKRVLTSSALCAEAAAARSSNTESLALGFTPSPRRFVALLILGLSAARIGVAETAVKAETFVDSVGINVHLDYANSAYSSRFDEVRAALIDLHVRHLREGLVLSPHAGYFVHLKELGSSGMKSIFITEPRDNAKVLSAFPAQIPNLVEGYEAPNEMDASKDAHWDEMLHSYLPTLYMVAANLGIPVIGPSLVKRESYATLGDVSSLITVSNLHNYPGGRNPGTHGWGSDGYGSLPYNQRNVRLYAPSLPIVTTETGYTNDLNVANSVPESIAAEYFPRLLLFQFLSGIKRTYIYELLSSGHEDYGLMSRDCERKPAFWAVKSLMELLDDHDTRENADALAYDVNTDIHDMQRLLLQKSNGRFFIAMWVEAASYDVTAKHSVAVTSRNATLRFPWEPASVYLHRWTANGNVETTAPQAGKTISVPVGDCLTVLEIVPPNASRMQQRP